MRLVFADILLSQFYLSAWRWRKTLNFLQPDEMPPARLLSFLRRNQCFLLGWPTAKEADQVHQGWEGEIRTRMPLSTHRPVGNKRELVQWPSLCEKTAPKSWDVSLVLHVLSTAQFTVSVLDLGWLLPCPYRTFQPPPRESWSGTTPNKKVCIQKSCGRWHSLILCAYHSVSYAFNLQYIGSGTVIWNT